MTEDDRPSLAVGDRPWPWAAALAVMALMVSFWPMVQGLTIVDKPDASDIGSQWVSFAAYIHRTYLGGHFPLWDPHDLCGMPFLAFSHTGSLYPPTVLTYLIARSYPGAAAVLIFVHLWLASLAMLVLARGLGRSWVCAFALALAYTYAGFMFPNINFPPSLHTGAWLPLWYAGAWGLLDRPRLSRLLLAAAALAAMVHGGDLEMVVYAGLGLGFEIALRLREGRVSRPGLAALAVALIGGGLAALAQALPALELIHNSIRSQGLFFPDFNPAVLLLPLIVSFRFLVPPTAFPQVPFGALYYLGAFTALLVVVTLRTPGLDRKRLLIVPGFFVYLVLMYLPPFSSLSHRVPVLGALLVPFRALPVLEIFVLAAVAKTLDQWIAAGSEALPLGRLGSVYFIIIGAALPLSAAAGGPFSVLALLNAAVLIAAGTVFVLPRGRRLLARPRTRAVLVVTLVTADLYLGAVALAPRTDPKDLEADYRAAEFLADTSSRGRYLVLSGYGVLDSGLPFHLGMRINADTIDAHTRVPPSGAALRLARLYPSLLHYRDGSLTLYDQLGLRDPKNIDPAAVPLLNDMNVVWVVSRFPWKGEVPGLELAPVKSWPGLYLFIYRNLAAKPRAYYESAVGPVPATVVRPAPDLIMIEPGEGAFESGVTDLRLAESWYPGWSAEAGGEAIRIQGDELDLMRLVGAGPRRVLLRYTPASFRVGVWAGTASLAALGYLFVMVLIRRVRGDRPLTSDRAGV